MLVVLSSLASYFSSHGVLGCCDILSGVQYCKSRADVVIVFVGPEHRERLAQASSLQVWLRLVTADPKMRWTRSAPSQTEFPESPEGRSSTRAVISPVRVVLVVVLVAHVEHASATTRFSRGRPRSPFVFTSERRFATHDSRLCRTLERAERLPSWASCLPGSS